MYTNANAIQYTSSECDLYGYSRIILHFSSSFASSCFARISIQIVFISNRLLNCGKLIFGKFSLVNSICIMPGCVVVGFCLWWADGGGVAVDDDRNCISDEQRGMNAVWSVDAGLLACYTHHQYSMCAVMWVV